MRRPPILLLLFVLILGLAGLQSIAAARQGAPPASPVATPAEGARSCGAPGHHPIVFEGVNAADIEAAGLSGDPIIPGQEVTLEAGNGTPITLPAGGWTPHQHEGLVVVNDENATTGVLLATGASWTIRPTPGAGFDYAGFGPWLVGATDNSATDFWIVNPDTGTLLFASEVFGAPFAEAHMAGGLRQSGLSDVLPNVISFTTQSDVDVSAAIVLPSADPNDAWALDPDDIGSDVNAAMTTDGSRLALVDASSEIRVLDGFTGERVATHPLPEPDAQVQVIGIGSDDTSLLLLGDHSVWTVDIDTGETTILLEADVAIASITFDQTTGTALVPVDDASTVWLDPASGESRELDLGDFRYIPVPQDGWVALETDERVDVSNAVLDMATGEIATEPLTVERSENTATSLIGSGEGGVWILRGDRELIVLNGPSGQAFVMPVPEKDWTGWQNVIHGVSPNGGCIIYTRLGSGFENPPGVSWIAPLEPGAEWTEVPFEINGWLVIPTGPGVQQAEADRTVTPVPAATPAG